jgi:hypothetical protein
VTLPVVPGTMLNNLDELIRFIFDFFLCLRPRFTSECILNYTSQGQSFIQEWD